ncbi:MAG: zinc ribbon domain-containing protein [Candidatus Omnitrophica bacterium]|nr:zinc ribbon domain-containing protein [Candidatus Omnitrophota bacterium]
MMNQRKMSRYVCTHCGRRFEAEDKEVLECPACFWSSSVKKEEDVSPESLAAEKGNETISHRAVFDLGLVLGAMGHLLSKARPFLILLAIFAGVAAVLLVKWPEIRDRLVNRADFVTLKGVPGEKEPADVPQAGDTLDVTTLLSDQEKAVLTSRVEVSESRIPDEKEQKILDNRVPLKTGIVEKLPSQIWTLEQYKQLISEQERFYKVPLPWSYRRKLEKLFTEKYAASNAPFEKGDLNQARDLWVESLEFPIYANDVQKHRGVVLTMLRPFINDTLSKIGVVNSILAEREIRGKEQQISQSYQEFSDLIHSHSWAEALGLIEDIQKQLQALAQPRASNGTVPPYPASVTLVDENIRATLFDLLNQVPVTVSDLNPLRQDMQEKEKVIKGFLPDYLQPEIQKYDAALESIKAERWDEAEKALRQIEFPSVLKQDAEAKCLILKKLQAQNAELQTQKQ